MEAYEYRVLTYDGSNIVKNQMAELGKKGWKMTGVTTDNRGCCIIFLMRTIHGG